MSDIKVLKDTPEELEIEIENESHGVCNALRHILMENDNVEYAVYSIDHPLTGKPIMTIKTNGISPREALKQAASELKEESLKFKENINNSL